MKLFIRSLLQPPATSLLGPNFLFITLFSNTFNVCPSLSVRDKVSQPYKTTGKIMICYEKVTKRSSRSS